MLEADIVQCSYHRGRPLLRDVQVRLDTGRTVLLGPNGAGKTTLLKAIAGIVRFEGSLSLDGASLPTSAKRPASFRKLVGWLPQNVTAFPSLTSREHVAYVGWLKGMPTKRAWTEALQALEQVGLGSRANEKAGNLSGGQTRRLGIAGVLVHDPAYLLLDEPTAGLDPRERDRLIEILKPIEQKHAVLVSTHDTDSLIDDDSGVHVISAGATRFVGKHHEFIEGQLGSVPAERVRRAYAALVPED